MLSFELSREKKTVRYPVGRGSGSPRQPGRQNMPYSHAIFVFATLLGAMISGIHGRKLYFLNRSPVRPGSCQGSKTRIAALFDSETNV